MDVAKLDQMYNTFRVHHNFQTVHFSRDHQGTRGVQESPDHKVYPGFQAYKDLWGILENGYVEQWLAPRIYTCNFLWIYDLSGSLYFSLRLFFSVPLNIRLFLYGIKLHVLEFKIIYSLEILFVFCRPHSMHCIHRHVCVHRLLYKNSYDLFLFLIVLKCVLLWIVDGSLRIKTYAFRFYGPFFFEHAYFRVPLVGTVNQDLWDNLDPRGIQVPRDCSEYQGRQVFR